MKYILNYNYRKDNSIDFTHTKEFPELFVLKAFLTSSDLICNYEIIEIDLEKEKEKEIEIIKSFGIFINNENYLNVFGHGFIEDIDFDENGKSFNSFSIYINSFIIFTIEYDDIFISDSESEYLKIFITQN